MRFARQIGDWDTMGIHGIPTDLLINFGILWVYYI